MSGKTLTKWIAVLHVLTVRANAIREFDLTVIMPGWNSTHGESIACTSIRVPEGTSFMMGIEPFGQIDPLHHFNLHGCTEPGYVWPNGYDKIEPVTQTIHAKYLHACMNGGLEGVSSFICNPIGVSYTLQATGFNEKYPIGYGYEVGPRTRINYLAFTVHYLGDARKITNLGMKIKMQDFAPKNTGSFLFSIKDFSVPPLTTVYLDCLQRVTSNMNGLQVRRIIPHTHESGVMIAIFKIVDGGKWTLVLRVKAEPKQVAFPIHNVTVSDGDLLAIRCKMVNTFNVTLHRGFIHPMESCGSLIIFTYDHGPEVPFVPPIATCLSPEEATLATNGTDFPADDHPFPENDYLLNPREAEERK